MGPPEQRPANEQSDQIDSGIRTGCLFFIGLHVMAAAAGAFYFSSRLPLRSEEENTITVGLLLLILGFILAFAGLLISGLGVRSWLRARRRKELEARLPYGPWLWDQQWNPKGATYSPSGTTTLSLIGLVFATLFLSFLNWMYFSSGKWGGLVVAGPFDIILVIAWATWTHHTLRGLKFGNSRLEFPRFPYFLGEKLDVTLLDTDRLRGMTKLTVALRCYQVRQETRNGKTSSHIYSIYEDQLEFGPDDIHFGTGGAAGVLKLGRKSDSLAKLNLTFQLPEGDFSTRLAGPGTNQFWELETKADVPGLDYEARFRVPIYSR